MKTVIKNVLSRKPHPIENNPTGLTLKKKINHEPNKNSERG